MHTPPIHTIDMPPLLLLTRCQREAIKAASDSNAEAHRKLREGRTQSPDHGRDTEELKDQRKRDLCEAEIAEARRLGYI
jgi:hypothetical protein